MGRAAVHRELVVRAPLEQVFERLADHEGMADWPGVQRCKLVREGAPKNGLGAVREITAYGLKLQEEVVRFDPPRGFDYSIVKGVPVDHLGSISLRDEGGATRLTWHVRIESRVPLLAQALGAVLRFGLPRALAWFKADTERRACG